MACADTASAPSSSASMTGSGGVASSPSGGGSNAGGSTAGGAGDSTGSGGTLDPGSSDAGPGARPDHPAPGACSLPTAAFCDTFDAPSPGGNAGDLDDFFWSAARVTTAVNPTQGALNLWGVTGKGTACGKDTAGLLPPNDMFFCAGGPTPSMHFNDAYNDGGGFTVHSWRIRKPFDFANRTGIISFDAGGKSQIPGGHGFWFNVFIAEDPVPSPYQLGEGVDLFVKAGVGIEFEAGGSGECKADGTENSVSNVFVEQDYVITHEVGFTNSSFGNAQTGGPGNAKCFKTVEEVLNHIEIRISQSKIEVYASDAGNPAGPRLVAVANNLALPFSRGYVSFQQTHYNAHKCTAVFDNIPACKQCESTCPSLPPWTTYHMDNVGFDGPSLPMPRSYEVPDNKVMSSQHDSEMLALVLPDGTQINTLGFPDPYVGTGYALGTDAAPENQRGIQTGTSRDKVAPVTLHQVDLTNAKDAVLTLNAWGGCDPIMYRFNGGTWRTYTVPAPLGPHNGMTFNCAQATAIAMPIALSDLKMGDNTLDMYTNTGKGGLVGAVIANIELYVNGN